MKIHDALLDRGRRIVAGHRGMKAVYPENTILSFDMAVKAGVDMLELDLNVSSDGKIIVIHDTSLDRTTDGAGPVRGMSSADIKALDAGAKFDGRFAGLRVPDFDEFLSFMEGCRDILLNVEIKDRTHECVDKAVSALSARGMLGNCVFTCFDAGIVEYISRRYDLPCQGFPGWYMTGFAPGLSGTLSHMAAVGIEMRDLTPERVADYEQMGILPWAYCPDDERAAAYARYCGAYLVTSNNPAACFDVFRGG